MRQAPIPFYLLFIFLLAILSCNDANEKIPSAGQNDEKIKAQIIAFHERAIFALNQGNLDELISVYTDDVISMPPNQLPLIGKTAVRQMWANVLNDNLVRASVKPEEIQSSGNWAFERGTYEMTLNPKAGGKPVAD